MNYKQNLVAFISVKDVSVCLLYMPAQLFGSLCLKGTLHYVWPAYYIRTPCPNDAAFWKKDTKYFFISRGVHTMDVLRSIDHSVLTSLL